ncbi:hypothetical protein H1S01_11560 [Heliobacterium chlorum]|uniref:Uncharacterized protein n=1 Tax=Heliobacterium chlorum TaxID=2698 RepID=A0ABR7T472_HELCL|nr:hypothetical protein [Heliobacterium chlorum]MBC9785145.1 hypothetical protein [Heliobacterium chlorum]
MYWLLVFNPNEIFDFQVLDFDRNEEVVYRTMYDYVNTGIYPQKKMIILQAPSSAAALHLAAKNRSLYRGNK